MLHKRKRKKTVKSAAAAHGDVSNAGQFVSRKWPWRELTKSMSDDDAILESVITCRTAKSESISTYAKSL
jgi:hypothetical protein